MRIMKLANKGSIAAVFLGLFAINAMAADSYHTDYRVTLLGLSVAKANFTTQMEGRNYKITGDISSAGLVNVFTSLKADTATSGEFLNGKVLRANSYHLTYTRGKKTRDYDVRFQNGNVTATTIRPEPGRDADRWIPVAPDDLKSVLDPLGALAISDEGGLCSRTLPIYDGESRMDLVLSPKGKADYSLGDAKMQAIICSVRYSPKSGYNRGRSDIEYLKNARDMEIWFAKGEGMKLYAPVYARIPTRVGPLTISATRFGA